ncbi:DUF6445 family protein [Sphingomonas parapaucimobilis]|uniref:DUF6445 family protein n=1 Tax=Sphingomonas parapaucimobilis TaxID=28213 RepID=UPI00321AD3E1
MATAPTLEFATDAVPTIRHIGHEREPVVILDGATGWVEHLRDFAATRSTFAPAAAVRSAYPGLLGPAPIAYVDAMVRRVLPLISTHFTGTPVRPARARGNFSLVTTDPAALTEDQRVPHVDTADRLQFATVHFLATDNDDGTAFFRHRTTGFETLDAERLPRYHAARADDPPPPAGYCTDGDAAFEMIDVIAARPDRLILYRANLLHSGWITRLPAHAADPGMGRLTGNLFLQCRLAV